MIHKTMKKAKTILILTIMAGLLLGCRGTSYEQVLQRAEQQNATFDSITNIDSIQQAVAYFDRYGTANEQVRAHYLLACAYRDAAEAPKALEAFHDAADRADTTRSDCDCGLLMRLHAQMADLFYQQLLPDEMLTELSAQHRYALRAGDEKGAVNAIEMRANAYYLLEQTDSIIPIRQKAAAMYQQLGLKKEAARAIGPVIDQLIEQGDTAEARRCMALYEADSDTFSDGEPISRKILYYYAKGKYYLAVGRTDSAQILFRRLLQPGKVPSQQEAGYRGLYLLYKQTGQADSMAKYADLSYQQSQHQLATTNSENLRHMQALYQYSRSQKVAEQMTAKAHRNELIIYAAIILLLIVMAVFRHIWQKRRELQRRYDQEKINLSKAEAELDKLQAIVEKSDFRIKEIMEEKEKEILAHQEQIAALEKELNIEAKRCQNINDTLMATPAYQRVKQVLANPKDRMSQRDWQALIAMIDEKLPTFRTQLKAEELKLSLVEYEFCILIRLYFSPKSISVLTEESFPSTSMKRRRLLNKIFGKEGSPETFDKLIRQIV